MCGIVGLWHRDREPTDPAIVSAMLARIAHRGPDGTKVWVDGEVGLGHARLKVIDLSEAAAQPMPNEDETIWCVFNGEIYNFLQLRGELIAKGHQFRSHSDTEVIVHLYEEEGVEGIRRLEGMFAIVVWDRGRRRLVLARDRVGKKPLYYLEQPDRFAFASEIKAFWACPELAPAIREEAILDILRHGYVPTPQTLYQGIKALPPGHWLIVTTAGSHLEPYWDLPSSDGIGRPLPPVAACRQELVMLMERAVRKRLVADVPLGAFASGGIDSSIIVGLMARMMGSRIKTFSVGFEGDPAYDETAYAQLIARRFETDHHEVRVGPDELPKWLDHLIWMHDGPFGDASALPTFLLAQATKPHVTVVLNGDGGDELFAGYLRFAATIWAERIPRAWLGLSRRLIQGGHLNGHGRRWVDRVERFCRDGQAPWLDRFERWISYFHHELPELLQPEWAERLERSAQTQWGQLAERRAAGSLLDRLLYINLKTYLVDDLLVKMDRSTMAWGVEARSPFLDREVMEFATRLPDAMKLRGFQTKWILRAAFADLVPQEILRRGKMGFGVPLDQWFRGPLQGYVREQFSDPRLALYRYVRPQAVQRLLKAHLAGEQACGLKLWCLLTIKRWLELVPQWTQQKVTV